MGAEQMRDHSEHRCRDCGAPCGGDGSWCEAFTRCDECWDTPMRRRAAALRADVAEPSGERERPTMRHPLPEADFAGRPLRPEPGFAASGEGATPAQEREDEAWLEEQGEEDAEWLDEQAERLDSVTRYCEREEPDQAETHRVTAARFRRILARLRAPAAPLGGREAAEGETREEALSDLVRRYSGRVVRFDGTRDPALIVALVCELRRLREAAPAAQAQGSEGLACRCGGDEDCDECGGTGDIVAGLRAALEAEESSTAYFQRVDRRWWLAVHSEAPEVVARIMARWEHARTHGDEDSALLSRAAPSAGGEG